MPFVAFLLGWAQDKRDPEDPTQRRLLDIITRRLGINEACIQAEIGLTRGAVRWHLRFLEEAELLSKVSVGRENHYFPAGTGRARMEQFAMANHSRAKDLLREIYRDPGIPQYRLAERAGMTRKVLRHHLGFLTHHGLIVERRQTLNQCYFPGANVDPLLRDMVVAPGCDPGPADAAPAPPPQGKPPSPPAAPKRDHARF